ncbi:serine/threonine protein kinase [Corallococcus sp. M34]|nr:serine/threonine protein kinase [Citreicoccus inhibens]
MASNRVHDSVPRSSCGLPNEGAESNVPPPPAGQPFGKYTLLDRIATGGMAEIFRARMTAAAGVTKPVVIKKILPDYAGNTAFVSMFINEAHIAVGLSHGNIAQVFDFGEVGGEYFLAMEWVDGHPLSRVLRRARDKGLRALPQPLAVLVGIEMLRGLSYAHTRLDEGGRPLHIIHRDVSPQNVLLSYEGQVKLVDFGIARARLAGHHEAEARAAQGKYFYFSPEQARGEALDARSDVFAAGTVLYELLCGRLPFEGPRDRVLQRIIDGDFAPPRALDPTIPAALERILLTAMATERSRRFPTAQAFAESLARFLHLAAPDVSSSALAHLMGYLFEPDLVTEGRPVQLPREFLAEVSRWSRPSDSTPEPARPVPAEPLPPEPRGERTTQPIPEPPAPAPQRFRLRRSAVWLAPVGVALMATSLGLFLGGTNSFSVELSSSPPGAMLRVDGRPISDTTPALVTHLDSDTEHLVEVTLPGMVPWSQRLHAERGTTLAVHARLRRRTPPAALPAASRAQALEAASHEATFTPSASPSLSAAAQVLLIPPSAAARVRLDPSRTYGLRTEGRVSLGGPVPTAQAAWFVEGSTALPARRTFGVVGPDEEVEVSQAAVLYVFLLDGRVDDNRGALQVHVREQATGALTTLLLDSRRNTVTPLPSERFTLRALDPNTTYEVFVRQGAEPARTRGPGSEPVSQVLALHGNGEDPDSLEVLEVNHPTLVHGARWLELLYPDDAADDNSGSLTLHVSVLMPLAGKPPASP